jgi:hypothetical protein
MTLLQTDLQIRQLEDEVANASPGSTPKAWLAAKYDDLSELYFNKSRITRDSVDAESAQTHGRGAIELGRDATSDPRLAETVPGQWWAMQANRLEKQYSRFDNPGDLDAAIDAFDNALRDLPAGSQLRQEAMSNQANCFSTRFDVAGDASDVDRAIQIFDGLMDAGVSDDDIPTIQNNMAINYRSRFERLRNVDDLEQAERYAEAVVEGTDDDNINLPTRLLNLAVCRCMLFEEDEEIDQVNKALQELEKAATLSRAWGLSCLSQVLSKRARAMYLRYLHQNDANDMQQAIVLAQEALAAAPSDEVEDERAEIVDQLASFLSAVDDQRRPSEYFQQAILRGEIPIGSS